MKKSGRNHHSSNLAKESWYKYLVQYGWFSDVSTLSDRAAAKIIYDHGLIELLRVPRIGKVLLRRIAEWIEGYGYSFPAELVSVEDKESKRQKALLSEYIEVHYAREKAKKTVEQLGGAVSWSADPFEIAKTRLSSKQNVTTPPPV